MKTIKEPETTWSMKFDCSECKAVLEADESDLRYYEAHSLDGGAISFSVSCPHCDYKTKVNGKEIPPLVQKMARESSFKENVRCFRDS